MIDECSRMWHMKMIIFDPFLSPKKCTGADELLGGYSRHRTARAKRGVEGTRSEMLKATRKTQRLSVQTVSTVTDSV